MVGWLMGQTVCRWFEHRPWFFDGGWRCQRCGEGELRTPTGWTTLTVTQARRKLKLG